MHGGSHLQSQHFERLRQEDCFEFETSLWYSMIRYGEGLLPHHHHLHNNINTKNNNSNEYGHNQTKK